MMNSTLSNGTNTHGVVRELEKRNFSMSSFVNSWLSIQMPCASTPWSFTSDILSGSSRGIRTIMPSPPLLARVRMKCLEPCPLSQPDLKRGEIFRESLLQRRLEVHGSPLFPPGTKPHTPPPPP